MTRFVLLASLLIGSASLSWGYFSADHSMQGRWLLALGAVWLFAQLQKWRWFAMPAFVVAMGAAAYGVWLGLAPGWMVGGALGALFTWDLSDFEQRLQFAADDDEVADLERRHLLRLTIIAGLGSVLALVGMVVRLRFTFEWAALLSLLAALGVAQLVSWMRRGEQ